MTLIASDQLKVVIGLGATGISCAKQLAAQGERFVVLDTREAPANLAVFQRDYPEVKVILGPLDPDLLAASSEIVLSPGVAKDDPAIVFAVAQGVPLIGDIDLFCRRITAPIIAITGSNAKSSVTTLVGDMAREAGIDVGVGGNIGLPVLDFLEQPEKALYVLELSSFQLETTHDLRAEVACVLNLTPDHLDRYDNDFQKYYQAKHRVFKGCKKVVENLDDALTHPLVAKQVSITGFRMSESDFNIFGLINRTEQGVPREYLALAKQALMACDEILLPGRHHTMNALAALAIGHQAGFPMPAMLRAVKKFSGLEHRCQLVATKADVNYFNDSKGTNVGATVAAIEGLGATLAIDKKIVLIAGGDGKGASFDDLADPINKYVKSLVLIGTDATRIADAVSFGSVYYEKTMADAVLKSAELAQAGEIVLLSPACDSFDMFDNFMQRGDVFSRAAENL